MSRNYIVETGKDDLLDSIDLAQRRGRLPQRDLDGEIDRGSGRPAQLMAGKARLPQSVLARNLEDRKHRQLRKQLPLSVSSRRSTPGQRCESRTGGKAIAISQLRLAGLAAAQQPAFG